MNEQFKIVLDCLEEYSDAIFDYGKTYTLYKKRPKIYKDHFIESRKKAVASYEKFIKEISSLGETGGK